MSEGGVLAGGWITFLVFLTSIFLFSVLFTRYYQSRRDSEWLASLVTILGLTVCLATVALAPFDIFIVTQMNDASTGQNVDWANDVGVQDGIVSMLTWTYYGEWWSLVFILASTM
jgi:LMBR1 domain-containing protein 1